MSYNDALKLEVSILEALLQRNRCSHSKAKYFQRTSMALRAFYRSNVVDLSLTVETWKQTILDRKEELSKSSRNSKRQRETELWDLASIQKDAAQSLSHPSLLDAASTETLLSIKRIIQTSLPELLSRIECASQPLFLEISRGFFLPFCTIALAALARIRILLMRLGHHALDVVQDVQQTILASSKDASGDNKLFLTSQAMVALRTQFTELSDQQVSTVVHQEKLVRLRQSLGFTDSKVSVANVKDDPEMDQETLDTSSDTLENTTNRVESKDRSKRDLDSMDDADIGEAVLSSAPEEASAASSSERVERQSKSHPVIAPRSLSKRKSPEPTTTRVKLKKEKKAKKKRKEEGSSDNPVEKESSGKKEKKKKGKKQDFFDSLFD